MSEKSAKMVDLRSSRTYLDSNKCEGKADAARFNYLFSCCLVYDEDDEAYFPNKLDDYLENQEDPVALAGATEFYYLISGSDTLDDNLPENIFLKKFKFVDEKLRLVDPEGRLVDVDGKHIDENGLYIKWQEDGTSYNVDANGRKVTDEGKFEVASSPFLDDDGKPVDESQFTDDEEEKKPKKTRAKRKKKVKVVEETEAEAEAEDSEESEAEVEAEVS